MDEINNYLENYKLFGFQQRVVLRLSLFGHKIENIPNASPKLKEQLLHSKDRNIPYSSRKTTSTTLYMPIIKNHNGEQIFKYFLINFLRKLVFNK